MASDEESKPPVETATSSATMQLDAEDQKLIEELRRKRAESPSKKQKSEVDNPQEWQEFLDALSVKKIEFMDLDPQLRNSLKSSSQARADFLSVNVLTDHAIQEETFYS